MHPGAEERELISLSCYLSFAYLFLAFFGGNAGDGFFVTCDGKSVQEFSGAGEVVGFSENEKLFPGRVDTKLFDPSRKVCTDRRSSTFLSGPFRCRLARGSSPGSAERLDRTNKTGQIVPESTQKMPFRKRPEIFI